MNRYFALSCALHLALGLLVLVILAPSKKAPSATYTIDFIGSGKVVAMQQAAAPTPQPEVKKEAPAEPAKEPEVKKPDPKAYQSKSEISTKKQTKKEKPKPAPAPLAAPSILDEEKPTEDKPAETTSGSGGEGEFAGGNVQTDFATFPYPWYIAQVRNSLWSEWEKRRPIGVSLSALITFAIARDGKIKNLKLERSSGDDSYDFAAKSAVINAGPFEPLPMLYEKDELTVTLELKPEK